MLTPTNTAVTLLANLMLFEERDWRPVVDELDRPALYVGSALRWAGAEADMARERWPGMTVETIDNTRHAVFADDPEQFNRILGEFLATLPE